MSESNDSRPDIYIGLVGAAGTDLKSVLRELKSQLLVVGYTVEHIKVSELIKAAVGIPDLADENERIKHHMKAGDLIRSNSANGGGVAALAMQAIVSTRGKTTKGKSRAFVIDSFKHPDEIELFDRVYVRNYYTMSVHLPRITRQKNLEIQIAKDQHQPPDPEMAMLAKQIITDDEKSQGDKAQNVRDAFPKADFFVNGKSDLPQQIKRFVEIVFAEPFVTPTLDEYGMFMAKGAGYRSADLSRQVGATIIDQNGSLIGTGCNEAPYPGGGFYVDGHSDGIDDNRDYVKQIDPNAAEIQSTFIEIVGILREAGHIGDTKKDKRGDVELVDDLLQGDLKHLARNARIRSLIEFGRVVHAEMHAICDAAAAGKAVRDSSLYCTTFPCHLCAKHIMASGIAEVVYIEPYPKSLTAKLYSDEIEFADERRETGNNTGQRRLVFRPFHGVSPILFQRAFRQKKRKDSRGILALWDPTMAEPTDASRTVERPRLETTAVNSVVRVLKKAKAKYDSWSEESIDEEG
ncbi:anti-phage dCTP deaminase [Pontixanthobacter sp. CEM42]|uniref:anti-phage dCTP deaminase n=1 Tax=Pontixanthobacter sp. CEM42 TaxID=2792077 RepID=UPI001AE007B1|nr:anti-phage dCTP deaminase [Pontixanthobacter sp. CEM42]